MVRVVCVPSAERAVVVDAERVLAVVAEEEESVLVSLSVYAIPDSDQVVRVPAENAAGRVAVGRVVRLDDVVLEILAVEEDRIVGIARTVGVESANLVVVLGMARAEALVDGDVPQVRPRVDCAFVRVRSVVRGVVVVRVLARSLDDVVVLGGSPEVRFGKLVLATFLGLVESVVDAVDEEVAVAAPRARLVHVELRVAVEHLVDKRIVHSADGVVALPLRKRMVLVAAEVDFLEARSAILAKERELEPAHSVFAAEEETEAVLFVSEPAAHPSAHPDAAGDGELVRLARDRVDLLDHRLALPVASVQAGVAPYSHRVVEEAAEVYDHRDRRDVSGIREAPLDALALGGDKRLVHSVEHRCAILRAVRTHRAVGRPTRRHVLPVVALRRGEDVLEEDVRRRGVLLEDGLLVGRRGPDDRRLRYLDRPRVEEVVGRGGGAVERVVDLRAIVLGAREHQAEALGLVSVGLAEDDLRRHARLAVGGVVASGRRRREVDESALGVEDDVGRNQERLVVDVVVVSDNFDRVLSDVEVLDGDVEVRRGENLLVRARRDRDRAEDMSVDGSLESVGIAYPELDLAIVRERVKRERLAPRRRAGDAEHLAVDARVYLGRDGAGVEDAARCGPDEVEVVRGERRMLALRHREVDAGVSALLREEYLDVVVASHAEVVGVNALAVPAAARLGERCAMSAYRVLERVVAVHRERPIAGLRDVDHGRRVHCDVVAVPVLSEREVGVRRKRSMRALVGVEVCERLPRLGRVEPRPRIRVVDDLLCKSDRVGRAVLRPVDVDLESAGDWRHADRAIARLPCAVADAVLRRARRLDELARDVSDSERDVVELLSERQLRDHRSVGARERGAFAAGGESERDMRVELAPLRLHVVREDDEISARGNDRRAFDRLPLGHLLRRIVGHEPAGDVDVACPQVANLDPVDLRRAVVRRQRRLVGGHHLVDDERHALDGGGAPCLRKRHRLLDGERHRRAADDVALRRKERDDDFASLRNHVDSVDALDLLAVGLHGLHRDVRDLGDGERNVGHGLAVIDARGGLGRPREAVRIDRGNAIEVRLARLGIDVDVGEDVRRRTRKLGPASAALPALHDELGDLGVRLACPRDGDLCLIRIGRHGSHDRRRDALGRSNVLCRPAVELDFGKVAVRCSEVESAVGVRRVDCDFIPCIDIVADSRKRDRKSRVDIRVSGVGKRRRRARAAVHERSVGTMAVVVGPRVNTDNGDKGLELAEVDADLRRISVQVGESGRIAVERPRPLLVPAIAAHASPEHRPLRCGEAPQAPERDNLRLAVVVGESVVARYAAGSGSVCVSRRSRGDVREVGPGTGRGVRRLKLHCAGKSRPRKLCGEIVVRNRRDREIGVLCGRGPFAAFASGVRDVIFRPTVELKLGNVAVLGDVVSVIGAICGHGRRIHRDRIPLRLGGVRNRIGQAHIAGRIGCSRGGCVVRGTVEREACCAVGCVGARIHADVSHVVGGRAEVDTEFNRGRGVLGDLEDVWLHRIAVERPLGRATAVDCAIGEERRARGR